MTSFKHNVKLNLFMGFFRNGGSNFFLLFDHRTKNEDRCQFHQRFMYKFFVQTSFLAAFSRYVSALAPKFRTKNASVNVDEIDGRRV